MRVRNADGEAREFPDTLAWREVTLERTVPNTKLRGRDGAVRVGGDSLEPREFELKGVLQGDVERPLLECRQRLVQEADEWLGFLLRGALEITRSGWDERALTCVCTGHTFTWGRDYTWLEVTFTFRADDPYWYAWRAATVERNMQPGAELIITTAGGSASIYPALSLIAGPGCVNPTLTNHTAGDHVQYVGTVPQGQLLEITTHRSHATLNGAGCVGKMSPIPFYFRLFPGRNRITYAGGGPALVRAEFRERWI